MLDYYYKNKDKRLKQMRKYYENNLDKLKEYGRNQQKQWQKDHPNYYIENKEKFRKYAETFRKNHPDYNKKYRRNRKEKQAKTKLQNAVKKGILSRIISNLFNKKDRKNV